MTVRSFFAALFGLIIGGAAVGVLHAYPKRLTALETYCRQCGAVHARLQGHEILGAVISERTGGLLPRLRRGESPTAHKHTWVEPAAHVFPSRDSPTTPPQFSAAAFEERLVANRLSVIEQVESSPSDISLLDQAWIDSPDKANALIEHLLIPHRPYPRSAIGLLQGDGPWPERWARMDAFDAAYKCKHQPTSLKCTVTKPSGRADLVFEITPTTERLGGFSTLGL